MSRTFSTKKLSVLSVNVRCRCGFNWNARPVRETDDWLRPAGVALFRARPVVAGAAAPPLRGWSAGGPRLDLVDHAVLYQQILPRPDVGPGRPAGATLLPGVVERLFPAAGGVEHQLVELPGGAVAS